MFKSSSSIYYTFFAIDDVTMTSVNTYTSVMGISIKDKYLVNFLQENKKYGAKRLLQLFPNKNWSLDGLKALIEKKIDNRYCVDDARSTTTQYIKQQYLCCQLFFISAFSPPRLQFLLENI